MLSFPEGIEPYVAENTSPESPVFAALAKETQENTKSAEMQVGHVEGMFLKNLVRATGARRVLEVGTFTGYSALMMAEGMPDDGELITCDIDREATDIAKKYWAQSPHGKKIVLKLGRAIETIEQIDGPLDLVFLDADKQSYIGYWDAVMPKVRRGGVVLVDNVLWSGDVLDPADDVTRAIAAFNAHARRDPRVELVMLTIRDGITMACKL